RDFHVTGVQTCALPISRRPFQILRGVIHTKAGEHQQPRTNSSFHLAFHFDRSRGYPLNHCFHFSDKAISATATSNRPAPKRRRRSEERRVGKECGERGS